MNFSSAWLILFAVPFLQAQQSTDIKMIMERGQAPLPSKEAIYVQTDRKRVEYRNSFGKSLPDGSLQPIYGPHLAMITRCDLGQIFELNLDTSEYTVRPYPPRPFTKEEMAARGMPAKVTYVSDKPTLRIEVTTNDTGERKEIFGHTARHVLVTRKQIPLEGSVSKPQETVTDGWYIDADLNGVNLWHWLPCDRQWPKGKPGNSYLYATNGSRPIDKPEFVNIGERETGFAVRSTATTKSEYTLADGSQRQWENKFVTEVKQLDEVPLDPALFEVPARFKQVDHIERNVLVSASQPTFWQRVRAGVSGLFR
jgi:hypothetical protein